MAIIPRLPMPSKQIFFAYGLTRVSQDEARKREPHCPYCREDAYARPVKTPCGHLYCAECLVLWLDQHNTCPHCRRTLFLTDAQAAASSHESNYEEDEVPIIQWPQDIEPLDLRTVPSQVDPTLILTCLSSFTNFTQDIKFGCIDMTALRNCRQFVDLKLVCGRIIYTALCAIVMRLASQPGDNSEFHALCRTQWTQVLAKFRRMLDGLRGSGIRITVFSLHQLLCRRRHWITSALVDIDAKPNDEANRFDLDCLRLMDFLAWTAHQLGGVPIPLADPPKILSQHGILHFPSHVKPFPELYNYPSTWKSQTILKFLHRFQRDMFLNQNDRFGINETFNYKKMGFVDDQAVPAMLGAITWLASQPGDSLEDHEECRDEWIEVAWQLCEVLHELNGKSLTAADLCSSLPRERRSKFLILQQHYVQKDGVEAHKEWHRFQDDVEMLIKWICWNGIKAERERVKEKEEAERLARKKLREEQEDEEEEL